MIYTSIYEGPNTRRERNLKAVWGESHLHPLEQIIPCHARHAVVSDDEIDINILQQEGGRHVIDWSLTGPEQRERPIGGAGDQPGGQGRRKKAMMRRPPRPSIPAAPRPCSRNRQWSLHNDSKEMRNNCDKEEEKNI